MGFSWPIQIPAGRHFCPLIVSPQPPGCPVFCWYLCVFPCISAMSCWHQPLGPWLRSQAGTVSNGSIPCYLFVTMFKTCTQTIWIHPSSYRNVFQHVFVFSDPSGSSYLLAGCCWPPEPSMMAHLLVALCSFSRMVLYLYMLVASWICWRFPVLSWLCFPLSYGLLQFLKGKRLSFFGLPPSLITLNFTLCFSPYLSPSGSDAEIMISLKVQLQEPKSTLANWRKKGLILRVVH